MAESSVPETMVAVGENGAHMTFEDWVVSADTEDNSTIVAAVTTLGISESEGAISHEHTYYVERVDQIRSQNICNVLHTTAISWLFTGRRCVCTQNMVRSTLFCSSH